MGEVYLAEDTRLERKTALKILFGNVGQDEERMQRFVREAKSAFALNHSNIKMTEPKLVRRHIARTSRMAREIWK